MKTKNKIRFCVALMVVVLGNGCRTTHVVYDQRTGEYVEGKAAKKIIEQESKIIKAREDAKDRAYERSKDRRESSRTVTRESVLFGKSIDEFDVMAARDRALQAEADLARTQAENAEAAARARQIQSFEQRYERALQKQDSIEVIPGVFK